ncbi:hypothetical protein [Streptomyces sp. NPDC058451]|uniref:hypothetical protein n=1 Tax=Streptomyces sp. NPDC058451 TaxID=3346506 RepID=UPI0036463321
MHGPGYAPPQPPRPSTALVVGLRVLFVALSLLSVGFLAWGTMLRVACMTRARRDWVLFVLSLVVLFTACVFIGVGGTGKEGDPQTWHSDVGAALFLLSAFGSVGYFLYRDLRHHEAPLTGQVAHGPAAATVAYGYPPSPAPQSYGPPPAPYGLQPAPYSPPRPGPYAPPQPASYSSAPNPAPVPARDAVPGQPQRPAPARIDQVRAELDELSDFLRGQDTGPGQGGQPGHGGQFGPGGRPGQGGAAGGGDIGFTTSWGPEDGR